MTLPPAALAAYSTVNLRSLPPSLWLLAALPALWLLLFALYCLRTPRPKRPHAPPASPFLPSIFIDFAYWLYQTPVRAFHALGVSPDHITLASLAFTVLAAALIASGRFGAGGWILLFAFTCDVWDGLLARLRGTPSRAGEFLDATVDRYNDLIGFAGFLYYYRDCPVPFLLTLTALIGSTLVSYARARGETLGISVKEGFMRRSERAVWLGAATVLAPLFAHFVEPDAPRPSYHAVVCVMALLALFTNLTALARIRTVLAALRAARP